jgi:hypothetical protein
MEWHMHARSFLPLAALLAAACAPALPARPEIAPVSQSVAIVDTPATAVSRPEIPQLDFSTVNIDVRQVAKPR